MGAGHRRSEVDGTRLRALRSLVSAYSKPLSAYFRRRIATPEDVPDLVQEVFLRLSRMDEPDTIRRRDSFIFVTAGNVLRDRARHRKARAGEMVPIEQFSIESSDFAPDRVLESKQVAGLIRMALLELPERTRDVFVLRTLEGQKMADVARALGISTRAAEKHQARALAQVAERLKDWRP